MQLLVVALALSSCMAVLSWWSKTTGTTTSTTYVPGDCPPVKGQQQQDKACPPVPSTKIITTTDVISIAICTECITSTSTTFGTTTSTTYVPGDCPPVKGQQQQDKACPPVPSTTVITNPSTTL